MKKLLKEYRINGKKWSVVYLYTDDSKIIGYTYDENIKVKYCVLYKNKKTELTHYFNTLKEAEKQFKDYKN